MLVSYFVSALVCAGAIFINRNHKIIRALAFVYLASLCALNVYAARHLDEPLYGYFRADALSIIFLTLLTILSAASLIHHFIYISHRGDEPRHVAIHISALVLFITMMSGVLLAAHVGLMWAFLEASTLAGSVLIYFHRNPLSLEATWKYVFVCSIGIALAFAGILFLSIATQQAAVLDLSLDALRQTAPAMEPMWLKICFLFILAGFSVKMGIVPLFSVDIDAKDLAPTPVGALFSSALMNTGFVAIFRFYEAFSHTSILHWMNKVLMITGFFSVFFATIYLLKIRNYKRMFAYSSLDHAGLTLLALSAGGLGYFAAVFHLILHALAKSSLFFQLGQVYRTFKSMRVEDVGGYLKRNPGGGFVLIVGFLAVTGMPPTGLFFSELFAFKALLTGGYLWLVIPTFVLLLFIIGALSSKFFTLLFGQKVHAPHGAGAIHPFESATQWLFLLIVVCLGLYLPDSLRSLINAAIQHLPK